MKERVHKLTEMQKNFVAEYQVDLNGTRAAIRAGYSPKTAEVIANKLVKKSWVAEAIKKEREDHLHKVGVRADKVLTRMARIGYADIRKIFGPNHTILPPEEWPDDIAAAIGSIEVFEKYEGEAENRILVGYLKKVRLWNPDQSLTNMARNQGVIGNGKYQEESGEIDVGRPWTPLELAAKLVFYRQIIQDIVAEVGKRKEIEGEKEVQSVNPE